MIQSYVLGISGLLFRSFRYFEGTGHENERHTMQVYILMFEDLEKKYICITINLDYHL